MWNAHILELSLLAVLGWASSAWAGSYASDRILLIPDQFLISERFHQPQFSIGAQADGYKVKLTYTADTEDLSQYLYQLYGAELSAKEIYEVELLPVKIRHFSSIFDEKTIVKSWRATFQLNEIHLEYQFTKDFSESQIRSLFTFGYVLAAVDAEVQCSGQITSRQCDQIMSGIPLFNQYALAAASDDKELFTDYGTLAKYLSFVRLGKAYLHLDRPEDVDIYLRSLLFSGDLCRSDLEPSAANICRLISKYSQNRSITSAIRIVSDRIFQSRPLDASKNFYLLDGSQFSLTQQEAVSDQHCSVFDAFCPISR